MNYALWLGVILGAASLLFLYLANQKSNKDTAQTVTNEVNRVLNKIATVENTIATEPRSGPASDSSAADAKAAATRREAQQNLANIQQDFSQWASDYIKNRDLKKLELDREKLAARTEELKISNDYRPVFQCAVDAVRGIIQAYNKQAGTDFRMQLNDVPTNLYLPDSFVCEIGTVDFAGTVKWRAYISATKPANPTQPPLFQIDIQYPHFNTNDAFRIEIQPPNFKLIAFGGGVATAARLDTVQPLDSFQAPVRAAVQKLVETQISSLATQ